MTFNFSHISPCGVTSRPQIETLWDVLGGSLVESSGYDIQFRENKKCTIQCVSQFSVIDYSKYSFLIENDFDVYFQTAANSHPVLVGDSTGLRKYSLFNHLKFTFVFNKNKISDFYIQPVSRLSGCAEKTEPLTLSTGLTNVTWTYEVEWVEGQVSSFPTLNVDLFEIFDIVLILIIHCLIMRFSRIDPIKPDFFRRPKNSNLLSIFVGSGIQISLLYLASFSPGSLFPLTDVPMEVYVSVVCLSASLNGFLTSNFLKFFGNSNFKINLIINSFLFFPFILGSVFILNHLTSHPLESSRIINSAIIYATLYLHVLTVSSYFGYRSPPFETPAKIHPLPDVIPPQPIHLRTLPLTLVVTIIDFFIFGIFKNIKLILIFNLIINFSPSALFR